MRIHSNRWVDFSIKLVTTCAAALATLKALLWIVHPTIVAAQVAILHPAMVRIDAIQSLVERQETIIETQQAEDRVNQETMQTILQMLAPPGSPERARIAHAFKKRKMDGSTPQAGATDPR